MPEEASSLPNSFLDPAANRLDEIARSLVHVTKAIQLELTDVALNPSSLDDTVRQKLRGIGDALLKLSDSSQSAANDIDTTLGTNHKPPTLAKTVRTAHKKSAPRPAEPQPTPPPTPKSRPSQPPPPASPQPPPVPHLPEPPPTPRPQPISRPESAPTIKPPPEPSIRPFMLPDFTVGNGSVAPPPRPTPAPTPPRSPFILKEQRN